MEEIKTILNGIAIILFIYLNILPFMLYKRYLEIEKGKKTYNLIGYFWIKVFSQNDRHRKDKKYNQIIKRSRIILAIILSILIISGII